VNKKVTLLFPGQGSQYVGMGKNFAKYFQLADEVLSYSLSKICWEGPEEELKLTANTQPAIVTHSLAMFQWIKPILEENKASITQVLGHSVGEYSALSAAGVLTFEEAVKAVHFRGRYMQEAVPAGKGKMVAILRASDQWAKKACLAVSNLETGEVVAPANFNDPEQVVIAGTSSACDLAVNWLTENCPQKFRAIELPVSAPFHSPLMKPAAEKLAKDLDSIQFKKLHYPYVANINAQLYDVKTEPQIIRKNLIKQVDGSVLWTQSAGLISKEEICLEVGPGKILKGLMRKINPEIKVISLDEEGAIDQLQEVLKS